MSVLWDILILELEEKKTCSFLLFQAARFQHSNTKLLDYMHLSTHTGVLFCFIPLISTIISVLPRDTMLCWFKLTLIQTWRK